MNDCLRFQELISVMLDGELSEPQKTELEAHIKTCRECARLYEAFAFISLSIDEGLSEPPESLCAGIMDGIRLQSCRSLAAKKRPHGWGRLAALAACLAIFVFAASKSGVFPFGSSQSIINMPTAASDMNSESAWTSSEDTDGAALELYDEPSGEAESTATPFSGNDDEIKVTPSDFDSERQPAGSAESHLSAPNKNASLLQVSKILVFSGESDKPDPEPIIAVTDEESLLLIMKLLAFSESGDDIEVSGAPVFILDVIRNDGTDYNLSVWIVDGRLCCVSDIDGILYVADGNASDLFDFISAA